MFRISFQNLYWEPLFSASVFCLEYFSRAFTESVYLEFVLGASIWIPYSEPLGKPQFNFLMCCLLVYLEYLIKSCMWSPQLWFLIRAYFQNFFFESLIKLLLAAFTRASIQSLYLDPLSGAPTQSLCLNFNLEPLFGASCSEPLFIISFKRFYAEPILRAVYVEFICRVSMFALFTISI